jgi:F-type H+-transporting ATPase subunit b
MSAFDLHLCLSELFWLLVIFGGLYLLVRKIIVPAAERIMHNRQNVIDANIFTAQDLADKTKALKEQYNKDLQKISDMVDNIRKDAQNSVEKSFTDRKKSLDDELKMQIKQSALDIESSTVSFLEEGSGAYINLAAFLIQMITGQPANLKLLKESYNKIK